MPHTQSTEMITVAIDAAKETGIFLKENFGGTLEVTSKGDRNLATELDRAAESLIVEKIRARFPSHGILAEEKERSKLDSDWLWIVDPLDGTHNFIRHMTVFGVSIGLLHKNEFVAGVIYMPIDDELYVGEKGNGSYKNGVKIAVSRTRELKDCSVSFDSSIRYAPDEMLAVLKNVSQESFNIRMFGSSVRHLTYVAEGKLDFSIEFHDNPWDFAGGVCLIREAGGTFSDLSGNPPTAQTIGYIASNGITHPLILNAFFNKT